MGHLIFCVFISILNLVIVLGCLLKFIEKAFTIIVVNEDGLFMVKHEKLEGIVERHLGQIFKFTIDFKVDDRTKLAILYEDESGAFFEYKLIMNFRTRDIEFIKHKGISLRQEVVKSQLKQFETELFEFMVSEIYNG
jgi:hypothetical protein